MEVRTYLGSVHLIQEDQDGEQVGEISCCIVSAIIIHNRRCRGQLDSSFDSFRSSKVSEAYPEV